MPKRVLLAKYEYNQLSKMNAKYLKIERDIFLVPSENSFWINAQGFVFFFGLN